MNRIDYIKKRKKMSYQDIANKANVTASYIWLLAKNKRRNPSLETMKRIAYALDERVEKVFIVN